LIVVAKLFFSGGVFAGGWSSPIGGKLEKCTTANLFAAAMWGAYTRCFNDTARKRFRACDSGTRNMILRGTNGTLFDSIKYY
jgi:hypothetical protein